MSIIPAKCPQCGANIQIDNEKNSGICESCGTPYLTEKAIDSNVFNIQHATITIQGNANTALSAMQNMEKGEQQENIAVADADAADEADKSKFAVAFGKGKEFMTRHGHIWQVVKFTLISLIAFIAEFASMYALQYGLEGVLGNREFHWFIFHYAAGREGAFGTAGFIAMLVSKCIAEIISFTINRKKTFKANNNVVFSAIMYVLTVIALILFTTWLAGVLGDAIGPAIGADAGNTISKMLGSLISWVVIFLMDKFVIMRRVDKDEEENAETADAAEALAADTSAGETVSEVADKE